MRIGLFSKIRNFDILKFFFAKMMLQCVNLHKISEPELSTDWKNIKNQGRYSFRKLHVFTILKVFFKKNLLFNIHCCISFSLVLYTSRSSSGLKKGVEMIFFEKITIFTILKGSFGAKIFEVKYIVWHIVYIGILCKLAIFDS